MFQVRDQEDGNTGRELVKGTVTENDSQDAVEGPQTGRHELLFSAPIKCHGRKVCKTGMQEAKYLMWKQFQRWHKR